MKILLVSWSILPAAGGSSIIIENLAKNFSQKEMMVVGAKPMGGTVKYNRPSTGPIFLYYPSEISLLGRGKRFFKKLRFRLLNRLIAFLTQVIKENGITHVLGVFPDELYCLAACRASQKSGIHFSSYFHNTYIENAANKGAFHSRIQAEIFDHSRHIFVMSRGMEKYYQKHYQGDKFKSLVHTFHQSPEIERQQKKKLGAPYQLVAIGNFNESNIEATQRFIQSIGGDKRYSLTLFTHVPKVLLEMRGIDTKSVTLGGFIHPDQVVRTIAQYDLCILTHGFSGAYGPVEYETIFPTRTIPLMLSGVPILVHSPPGSFLTNYITENNCGYIVDRPDINALKIALEKLTTDLALRNEYIANAKTTVKMFYGPTVASYLKTTLLES